MKVNINELICICTRKKCKPTDGCLEFNKNGTCKKQYTQEEINHECRTCLEITCPKQCFEFHVGSMIALSKLVGAIEREEEIKIHVVGE